MVGVQRQEETLSGELGFWELVRVFICPCEQIKSIISNTGTHNTITTQSVRASLPISSQFKYQLLFQQKQVIHARFFIHYFKSKLITWIVDGIVFVLAIIFWMNPNEAEVVGKLNSNTRMIYLRVRIWELDHLSCELISVQNGSSTCN